MLDKLGELRERFRGDPKEQLQEDIVKYGKETDVHISTATRGRDLAARVLIVRKAGPQWVAGQDYAIDEETMQKVQNAIDDKAKKRALRGEGWKRNERRRRRLGC